MEKKIKVRADMFCKLCAASCGVKDGELLDISKYGNHLDFKVKIHHQENPHAYCQHAYSLKPSKGLAQKDKGKQYGKHGAGFIHGGNPGGLP